MIVVLSTGIHDYTTDEICNWLEYYNSNYIRINGESFVSGEGFVEISNESKNVFFESKYNHLFEPQSKLIIFNRRWYNFLIKEEEANTIFSSTIKLNDLYKFYFQEITSLSNYFYFLLSKKNTVWIDHPSKLYNNKLITLKIAAFCGLNIPPTLCTCNKSDLEDFIIKTKRVIVKPMSNIPELYSKYYNFNFSTKEITFEILNEIPLSFSISLFQKLIEKKYEIRIFYFLGDFFPMAIFSQNRRESLIDFRNYSQTNPDRFEPYNLEANIRKKLRLLLSYLDYKTCSIDLILSTDNKYYFLEINPVGQFGMVSKPCNYNIENFIVKKLIALDEN